MGLWFSRGFTFFLHVRAVVPERHCVICRVGIRLGRSLWMEYLPRCWCPFVIASSVYERGFWDSKLSLGGYACDDVEVRGCTGLKERLVVKGRAALL